jgi:hypothetical protein
VLVVLLLVLLFLLIVILLEATAYPMLLRVLAVHLSVSQFVFLKWDAHGVMVVVALVVVHVL